MSQSVGKLADLSAELRKSVAGFRLPERQPTVALVKARTPSPEPRAAGATKA
jgi:hypothetical protein